MSLAKRVFPVAVVIAVVGVALFVALSSRPSVPTAHATSRTIMLTGSRLTGWNGTNPGPIIVVTKGDTISMSLVSGDGAPHTFIVDVDRDGVIPSPICTVDKCSSQFSSTTTFMFTADMAAGDYTYYCSIHLTSMIGTFRVQAPPPTPDFSIGSSPSSLTFLQGASGTSTVTVTSVNGFSGTISLTAGSSPSGPTVSLSPMSVTISSGTSATSTLTVSTSSSTPSGTYTVSVNGTSGSTVHPTTVTVQVNAPAGQDFTITSNPASLNVTQGSSSSSTITLTSVNGFSGILSLTGTISPSGPKVTLSAASVSLPASGSVTFTATVSTAAGAYSSVATGNYSLNITASNGSIPHSKLIPVTVGTPAGGLPVVLLVGAAIVILAALGVVVYLVRRKPRAK